MKFTELGLKDELLKALDDLKFEEPTPIQEKAIPILLPADKDMIGLAQTGTGKTAAFGLPLLNHVDPQAKLPQGVIICPTRELCMQITNDLQSFSKHMGRVTVTAVYGGASISTQINQLRRGTQVIVATPGRLLDLIRRRAAKLSDVRCVVLDEADEMLNMGFQEDIDAILDELEHESRVWLFSATMPRGVRAIANKYLKEPEEITIGTRNLGAENITHSYYTVLERNKYLALKRILDFCPEMYGLIFCRTRRDTQEVAEALMRDGYNAEALHGDLSQSQRDYVMRKFRTKTLNVLCATDVAARGLDVNDITHVINFTLPDDAMAYTHRSGRTARAGKSGISIALIGPRDLYRIRELERRSGLKFKAEKLPDGKDICRRQLFDFVEKLIATEVDEAGIAEYLPQVYATLGGVSKEDLVDRIISREFTQLLDYYRNTRDINAEVMDRNGYKDRKGSRGGQRGGNPRGGKFSREGRQGGMGGGRRTLNSPKRFFVSMGRLDKINKGAIVRFVCDSYNIKSSTIGEIDMKREYSFVDLDQSSAKKVLTSKKKTTFDGKPVKIFEALKNKKPSTGARRGTKRKFKDSNKRVKKAV